MRTVGILVLFLALTYAAAAAGSIPTASAIGTWYRELHRPSWTPPDWLFGPVWTLLYTLMAIAAWLVWKRSPEQSVSLPLTAYFVQLTLNTAWTLIFFGLHRPGLAFAEIAVLWLAILATIVTFWRVSPTAGVLLLPYIAWVTFASALNFSLWQLNRPGAP
jgi:translocator protein